MEKKWWVLISAVVLILIILVVFVFVFFRPKNVDSLNNPPAQTSNNNSPATTGTSTELPCLNEGQSGILGTSKCCEGLSEQEVSTQGAGNSKVIVCVSPSSGTNTYCIQDSDCSSGLKCWKEVPTSLRAGIPGTATQPGVCSQEVGNIQE